MKNKTKTFKTTIQYKNWIQRNNHLKIKGYCIELKYLKLKFLKLKKKLKLTINKLTNNKIQSMFNEIKDIPGFDFNNILCYIIIYIVRFEKIFLKNLKNALTQSHRLLINKIKLKILVLLLLLRASFFFVNKFLN